MAAPLRLDPEHAEDLARLGAWLAAGKIAALPTDTVPGLAAALGAGGAPAAAARLAALKGAPADKACALHLPGRAELERLAPSLPPGLPRWLGAHLPGPWTVLLPARWLPQSAAYGWSWPQVGVRLPRSRAFQACAAAAGAPLLMTSINAHGEEPLHGAALAAWLEARDVPAAFDPVRVSPSRASRILSFEPLPRLVRGDAAASELRPGLRVLVVCSGNICRSPLAAAILRQELAAAWGVRERDLAALGWHVESAGTFAQPGADASEHAQAAAAEIGLHLASHRARSIAQAFAGASWDVVFGMGRNHLASLESLGVRAEAFDPSGQEVADPFGADLATYRLTRTHLLRAAQERVEAWSRWEPAAKPSSGARR